MAKKRRRTAIFIFILISIPFIIIPLIGEIYLRVQGFSPKMINLIVKPKHLFLPDSILGWRLKSGIYRIYVNDPSIQFTATINRDGYRITSSESEVFKYSNLPVIQLYGCSCTFGFSVPDSLTQGYQLQNRLPNFRVENKGVPGYGLTQMFLLLKETVANGDTPRIAIFNYGDFHDFRVPLSKTWSNQIRWSVEQGSGGFEDMSLPYYSYENGALQLNRTPFAKLPGFWPLANRSSFVLMLNIIYDLKYDDKIHSDLHKIAHSTAIEMVKFCHANHITPIFASIVNSSDNLRTNDIYKDLENRGDVTLNYGIDFAESKYNCGPFDKGHPNVLAHHIYAEKLYQLIISKGLNNPIAIDPSPNENHN